MAQRHVMQLQQEAAQRVQRMAERSRQLVREQPIHVYRGATVTPIPPAVPEPCEAPAIPAEPQPQPCACTAVEQKPREKGVLSFLAGDEERVLLLLLIAILGQNSAPPELLLALLYVAL